MSNQSMISKGPSMNLNDEAYAGDKEKLSPRVSFGKISLRVYKRTISDNPSVRIGAPVGLDWTFKEVGPYPSIDVYERSRVRKRRLLLSYYDRRIILEESGFSRQEIRAAEKEVKWVQMQRKMTMVTQLPTAIMYAPFQSIRNEWVNIKNRKIIRQYQRQENIHFPLSI